MLSIEENVSKVEATLKASNLPEEDITRITENSRIFFEYQEFMVEKTGLTPEELQKVFGEYMTEKLTEDMNKLDGMSDEERKEVMGNRTQQDYMKDFSLLCMEEYAKENEFPKWNGLAEAFIAIGSLAM